MKKTILIFAFLLFSLISCSNEELVKKNKRYESENTKLKNQLDVKETEVKYLKKAVAKSDKEITDLKAELNDLRKTDKDYAVIKTKMRNLKKDLKVASSENQRLKARFQGIQSRLQAAVQQNNNLRLQVQQKQQQLTQLSSQLSQKDQELKRMNKVQKTLQEVKQSVVAKDEELNRLNGEVKQLQALKVQMENDAGKLKQYFKDEIKRGDVSIDNSFQTIKVVLMEKVVFRKAEVSLTPKGEKIMKRIATYLKNLKDKEVFVIGHADSDPVVDPIIKKFFPTNWEFSVMRAVMVVRYLTEILKLDPSMFTAAGRSYYHPISKKRTKEAKMKNRRTEILIFPKYKKVEVNIKSVPKKKKKSSSKKQVIKYRYRINRG